MVVWKCVQVNLGQKYRKLARMIQGIKAQPSTRIKRAHLTATHEKKHSHKQCDMSSIHGNIFSTNQTRVQRSTGPLEHLNRFKTRPLTHICHVRPQEDLTVKGEAEWAWPILGRPPWSAGHGSAPPTYPLSVKLPGSSLKSVHDASLPFHRVKASFSPLINMRGGGKNRDTLHTHNTCTSPSLLELGEG